MLGRVVLEITAAPATGLLLLPLVGEGLELAATHIGFIYNPKKVSQAGLLAGLTMAVRLQAVSFCMYMRRSLYAYSIPISAKFPKCSGPSGT
jgi:hypothetical protein